MEEITVRDIIRETQGTIDGSQTFKIEGGARVLYRLKQLEKRIEDANSFLGGKGDTEFGCGIVFALEKILGK